MSVSCKNVEWGMFVSQTQQKVEKSHSSIHFKGFIIKNGSLSEGSC